MNELERKIRIYYILREQGNNEDAEYFEKLTNTKFDIGLELEKKNNLNAYFNQKRKCPNPKCQKEVYPKQIYCLEDLGIVFCDYCQDTVE